jgi:hypothetical protein
VRRLEDYRRPLKENLPRVRLVHAPDQIHERGFSGPVLAHYGVHRPLPERQAHIVEGLRSQEAFS